MRKKLRLKGLYIVLTSVLLAACGSAETVPQATNTALPPTPILTPTVTATLAPPTPTNTPVPTLPTTGEAPLSDGPVQAIILFIGDGMGIAQRTAGRWASVGEDGFLAMDQMQVAGWSQTSALQNPITDSAAAGTALSTGQLTRLNRIGVDADGNILPTILEQAHDMGWSVGLVSTTMITHATPAAFASHIQSRSDMLDIAVQMMGQEIEVILGGGEDDFLPRGVEGCFSESSERIDERNLIEEAIEDGYDYVCDLEGFQALDTSTITHLLGLFADEGMLRPFSPTLAEMTNIAIEILSQNPNGFFLMVEGGQIDWAGHDNLAEETMESVIGFDAAVAVGQAYAETQTNTLLIVTADHETGGMSLLYETSGSFRERGPFYMPDETPFYFRWGTTDHTGVDVPVTAQGPWASLLEGTYPITHIYDVMYAALTGEEP